jgi:hypothetical protein
MLKTGSAFRKFTPPLIEKKWDRRPVCRLVGSLAHPNAYRLLDREWLLKDPAAPVSALERGIRVPRCRLPLRAHSMAAFSGPQGQP